MSTVVADAQHPAAPPNREDWIDPHAWKRRPTASANQHHTKDVSACPPCAADAAAARPSNRDEREFSDFVYRKLVNFLTNEQRMKTDPATGHLHRTLHIHLSRQQLDALRAADNDLRRIDGVLQEVWQQSRQGTMQLVREVLWTWSETGWRLWHDWVWANRWLVNAVQLGAIVAGCALARRYGVGVGLLGTIGVAFAVYRYLDADCHRRLDIERIADLMRDGGRNDDGDGDSNPCASQAGASGSWYHYLFGGSRREDCIRYLEQRYEQRECDVKALYDAFVEQFVYGTMESFFVAMVRITSNIRGTYGYLGMLLVTVLIYANLGVIVASVFRYVIGPVMVRVVTPAAVEAVPAQQQPAPAVADQLSSANIERLLHITESNTRLATVMAERFRVQCVIAAERANETVAGDAPVDMPSLRDRISRIEDLAMVEGGDDAEVAAKEDDVMLLVSDIPSVGLKDSTAGCSSVNDDYVPPGDPASDDDIVILEQFDSEAGSVENELSDAVASLF